MPSQIEAPEWIIQVTKPAQPIEFDSGTLGNPAIDWLASTLLIFQVYHELIIHNHTNGKLEFPELEGLKAAMVAEINSDVRELIDEAHEGLEPHQFEREANI